MDSAWRLLKGSITPPWASNPLHVKDSLSWSSLMIMSFSTLVVGCPREPVDPGVPRLFEERA